MPRSGQKVSKPAKGKAPVENSCPCAACSRRQEFKMPRSLLEDLRRGNVVVFAGAGVSTESSGIMPSRFVEDIRGELASEETTEMSFPETMSKFCEQPNGRQKLVRKVKERFNYVESFPEIYGSATRFHQQLSTLHQIQEIVTTNWDPYFEQECGATPFVTASDFALWQMPGRKVFKLHGSIENPGSLILTAKDYEECHRALTRGVMGGVLKTMLATKTLLYVGYSFSDSDFIKIHRTLTKEMKWAKPHAYLVSIDSEFEQDLRKIGITSIKTDAAYFIECLKDHLIEEEALIPDGRLLGVMPALWRIKQIHEKTSSLNLQKYPNLAHCLAYQDGLIHAFQRIRAMTKTGEYSCQACVAKKIEAYEPIKLRLRRERNYWDQAYIEGYQNGLYYILASDTERRQLPLYFLFGLPRAPKSFEEFYRSLKQSKTWHKAAYRSAAATVANKTKGNPDITVHHLAFL